MPSSEPEELLDSWLGDGVEGFTISAVWRNLGIRGERLAEAPALTPHIPWPGGCRLHTRLLTQFYGIQKQTHGFTSTIHSFSLCYYI